MLHCLQVKHSVVSDVIIPNPINSQVLMETVLVFRVTGKLTCRVCDKVGLSRLDRHLADLHQLPPNVSSLKKNNMLPLLIHIGNIHDAAEHNGHQ